jgi:hypothetical protein
MKNAQATSILSSLALTALSSAVFLCPVRAHEAAGGDVRILSTINSGGSVQSGGDVQITGFVGEPGTVSTNGNVVARQGGNSMIYYATGFGVTSDSLTINESGAADANSTRTQLRGNVVYDDSTVSKLDGALIAWAASAPGSALASVSADGFAQAAPVYQATSASFSGTYGGINATSSLIVLNVLPDNYSVWAGDTFDDAWEIGQGMSAAVDPNAMNNGVPNWQLYAMGYSPEQPAPAVLASSTTTNGYLAVRYTRNPYAVGYTFTPQESGNLNVGFAAMVNPVSVTNTSGGVEAIVTRGSVPMNATNRQFLRVRVAKPTPTPRPRP